MIDLHIHSTFSDGSFTPSALAGMAAKEGLRAVALTDHDTTGGTAAFVEACGAQGVTGIAGVEVSADFSPGTMHILGYFVDPDEVNLGRALEAIRGGRKDRNTVILDRLRKLGMDICMEEVAAKAEEGVVGRPHFAQVMVEKGYVKSSRDAFDRYLAKGKPAYADRVRLTAADCVRLIRGAGGVAALAHPFTTGLGDEALRGLIEELAGAGLQGIEAYYSEHTDQMSARYAGLASEYGLILTGGSDFHGAINPNIEMGRGFGRLRVEDTLLEGLYRAAGLPCPLSS